MEKLLSKKDTLTKIYNEVLERNCRCEIDEAFFKNKATHFKKDSPDYKNNIKESEAQTALIYWNKLLLKTIMQLITNEGLEKPKN